jgi:hypothetical protein
LFRKEFCEENVDHLHGELLEIKQETSVRKYATTLRRTLSVVPLPVKEQIHHFLRGLKPKLFIVACAAGPKTLEEAIEAARRAERAHVPVRKERAAGQNESGNVQAWISNPENEQADKGRGSKFGLTDGKSPRKTGHEETKSHEKEAESVCLRCLQKGHFVKGCDRKPTAELHACCWSIGENIAGDAGSNEREIQDGWSRPWKSARYLSPPLENERAKTLRRGFNGLCGLKRAPCDGVMTGDHMRAKPFRGAFIDGVELSIRLVCKYRRKSTREGSRSVKAGSRYSCGSKSRRS